MRKVYAEMDGRELTPKELVRMLMRANEETYVSFSAKLGHKVYQVLQDKINKDERMRFDELYEFVKHFGGSICVEVPMPDGKMRTIELVCKEK